MNAWILAAEAVVVALLFAGIAQFRTPRGAWRGNLFSAAAFALAVGIVLAINGSQHVVLTVVTVAVGAVVGYIVALRVSMLQIPAMVAFQHGCGGVAAALVSFVELVRSTQVATGLLPRSAGMLGLVIGAATASGSVMAGAKLSGMVGGRPRILPAHSALVGAAAAIIVALAGWSTAAAGTAGVMTVAGCVLMALALVLGVLVAVRIGGADMPVLVSFLNASAGLAAAFAGVALSNRLLVVCGATVAASGSILTIVMCRAMNRSLLRIFTGIKVGSTPSPSAGSGTVVPGASLEADPSTPPDHPASDPARTNEAPAAAGPAPAGSSPLEVAVGELAGASRVVIVPGYGMALAQAQFATVELAMLLEQRGAQVCFAVHPVAGRMPGHMNVLLAEADASYDLLVEMEDVNPSFPATDVVVVVGACDVVNPAAQEVADTPIAGMPILEVHQARRVVVCNLDDQPGYSGVPNSLYERDSTVMLFGDARTTVESLVQGLRRVDESESPGSSQSVLSDQAAAVASPLSIAVEELAGASRVVIVPGYGMALAQAQFATVALATLLEQRGAQVCFAVHPVAGRMPGHMNVLLAEADASYDLLVEMDEVNPSFAVTDVAVVIGACDVVNPAAQEVADTPIAGMPILEVHQARRVVVCNLDDQPGYSGVPNSLYERDSTVLLFGDARATVESLVNDLRAAGSPALVG